MSKTTKILRVLPYVDASGGHRWRMRAGNGRVVADSAEAYSTRGKLMQAIDRLLTAEIVCDELPGEDLPQPFPGGEW